MKWSFLLFVLMIIGQAVAEEASSDEERWWERRHNRPDLYFPHNAHKEAMSQGGDLCMACHPFTSNEITDLERLDQVQTIYNEPLAEICHACHMEARSAPMDCVVCHTNTDSIRPPDHVGDYTWFHKESARNDEAGCRSCHIDLNFCTDCHFGRDAARRNVHPFAYRDRHGLEARMGAGDCAGCHQPGFCADCHARRRP